MRAPSKNRERGSLRACARTFGRVLGIGLAAAGAGLLLLVLAPILLAAAGPLGLVVLVLELRRAREVRGKESE